MESLALVLESIRSSLLLIAGMMTLGVISMSITLHRLGQMLRAVSTDVTEVAQARAEVSRQIAENTALLRDTHALTAKAAAALDNVARLVVYPGGRPT